MKLFTDQSEVSAPSCIMFMLILLLQEFPNCTVLNFYRLPTKLCEGNVFTDVCLSTGGLKVSFRGRSFLGYTQGRVGYT